MYRVSIPINCDKFHRARDKGAIAQELRGFDACRVMLNFETTLDGHVLLADRAASDRPQAHGNHKLQLRSQVAAGSELLKLRCTSESCENLTCTFEFAKSLSIYIYISMPQTQSEIFLSLV